MIYFFDRLDKFMKYKGLNDNKLTLETGISNGLIGKARKRGSLSQDNISKILYCYPELDANWLFVGEGEMLKMGSNSKSVPYEISIDPLVLNEEQANFKKEPIDHIMSEYERNLWDLIKSQRESITRLELSNEKLIEKVVGGKNPKEGASGVQHARVS
jgi:hypothetical protein